MQSNENTIHSFKQFLGDFCETHTGAISEGAIFPSCIRLSFKSFFHSEIEAQVLEWCLAYLTSKKCPVILAECLSHRVAKKMMENDSTILDKAQQFEEDSNEQTDVKETVFDSNKCASETLRLLFETCDEWNARFPEKVLPRKTLDVSVCSTKNLRRKMEDRHTVVNDMSSLFGWDGEVNESFLGVYDGHGGPEAANYAATYLHYEIARQSTYRDDIHTAIKEGYASIDNKFQIRSTNDRLHSGSTCVTAILRGNKLHFAWLGDSQIHLVKLGKSCETMSPHKPEREDEKERIEALGGCVLFIGIWRVNGCLSVSRSIGDVAHKPYISAVPDVKTVDLDGDEDYIILACDGLWDVITADELPQLVNQFLKTENNLKSKLAEHLVKVAKQRGSADNITILIVFLNEITTA